MNWDDLTGDFPAVPVDPRRDRPGRGPDNRGQDSRGPDNRGPEGRGPEGRGTDEPSGRIAVASPPVEGRRADSAHQAADGVASGDRAELHQQVKTVQRLKMATLTALSLVLLLAFPLYLGILKVTEDYSGNRWCIPECEFGQRSRESSHDVDETHQAYYTALSANGWRPRVGDECPAEEDGIASCWRRDQYVLDMWVREKYCEERPVRPTGGPGAGQSASPVPTPPPSGCGVSLVTVKVFNAVAYKRGI